MSEAAVRRKLARAEKRIEILETLTEDRTRELYLAMEQLREAAGYLQEIYMTVPGALIVFDRSGQIEAVNDTTSKLLEYEQHELMGQPISTVFEDGATPELTDIEDAVRRGSVLRTEKVCRSKTGQTIPVLLSATLLSDANLYGSARAVVCVLVDIRDRKHLEVELRQAQKLEAVGRLAAGVAHEINTPVQFVSDSIHFLKDAVADFHALMASYRAVCSAVIEGGDAAAPAMAARDKEDEIDLAYLVDNVPKAIERTLEGLGRVATIVRSMKEFAHPDTREMSSVDLNQAIQSTLTIARNEYKYVADIETAFGKLPPVTCAIGQINQAILNILVNAAHAIADIVGTSGERGRIVVRTCDDLDRIVISISDTGGGIPESVRERIFDPFFTTKGIGRGTGQGLAIARSAIEGHGGQLRFETEMGRGTTFIISLPIVPPELAP